MKRLWVIVFLFIGCGETPIKEVVVERFPNGGKKIVNEYKGDILVETTSYNTQGQKHGLWTSFHENGMKKKEINYNNGLYSGTWIMWYDNGQKMEEMNVIDSEEIPGVHFPIGNGKYTSWTKLGLIEEEGVYVDGKKHGKWTSLIGRTRCITNYIFGNELKTNCLDSDNKPLEIPGITSDKF